VPVVPAAVEGDAIDLLVAVREAARADIVRGLQGLAGFDLFRRRLIGKGGERRPALDALSRASRGVRLWDRLEDRPPPPIGPHGR
jgi:hypothetical protein